MASWNPIPKSKWRASERSSEQEYVEILQQKMYTARRGNDGEIWSAAGKEKTPTGTERDSTNADTEKSSSLFRSAAFLSLGAKLLLLLMTGSSP
jgi:hydroxyethylthiazole kinase-like sugar kinase family protein